MATVKIHHIFISPGHDFKGRYGMERENHVVEDVASVECVAGQGMKGDRFFGFKENFKGQITFFDWDLFLAIKERFNLPELPEHVTRRNVLIEGADLNSLVGKEFSIGPIRFYGSEECAPCVWMNEAIAPGAEEFMKNRGGLRVRVLTNGVLKSKNTDDLVIH